MQDHNSILENIFSNALRIENEDERASYIKIACGDDSSKLSELQNLLRDYIAAGDMFDRPAAVAPTLAAESTSYISRQIGPYKLRELLGEGGMGSVYVAEQEKPVRRKVALKIIKPGMGSREVISRFESERQALALMDHPNIARVLDAGTTDTGLPYFVMELVKGLPITEHCDTHKLGTRDRLELFLQVCQAVQHAHQKGIIHRDIKPSNVIVAIHDVRPVVKVIDFGVAKAIGQQLLTENTLYTAFSQMVGTPLYMSPEQAGQSSLDIDTRSDVYSLGVLLYEILTGRTPFESDTLRNAGFDEMRRMIREVDPPRPSLRVSTLDARALSTISDNRNVDARKLSYQLRGELDWIVMMALEKDRNRRYDTANEFADDVRHFLNDEAVQACPPSTLYRFRKLVSRNRAALSAATLVAGALIIGTAVSVWQAKQARDALFQAEHAKGETEIAKQKLDERYRIAKEAVDTYLLRITQDERLDHPSFRHLRQSLLEASLPYYDQLNNLAPADEPSRVARAEALNQLGGVKSELGQFADSRIAYEQAAEQLDELAATHPEKVAYRQGLAAVLVNLADHYRTLGAVSDSLAYEEHALAVREQLAQKQPDNDTLKLQLAQSYNNIGVAAPANEGRQVLERAIEIWQSLADRFPEQQRYRQYLSLGYHNLAHSFEWQRAEEAIPFHELAIELRKTLASQQPESKQAHIELALSHQLMANTLVKIGNRLGEARHHRETSVRVLQDFMNRYPQWPEVRAQYASALVLLAHSLSELGEFEVAQETCEKALQSWKQLVVEFPDMLDYQVGIAGTEHNLANILKTRGDTASSVTLLTRARDRLKITLERVGEHDRTRELLTNIYKSLSEAKKSNGQDLDSGSDKEFEKRKVKVAGEALRASKFLTNLSSSAMNSLLVEELFPILSQTEEQGQTMKRKLKHTSRTVGDELLRLKRPLSVEQLENRSMMAVDVSVTDGSAVEGDSSIRFIDEFVSNESGTLNGPHGLTIGPDGALYVANEFGNSVARFNATTGAPLPAPGKVGAEFVSSGSGLNEARMLSFGPHGDLYVVSEFSREVLRYDGTTGDYVSTLVASGSGGLNHPKGLLFHDGYLYVTCNRDVDSGVELGLDAILRFDALTGIPAGLSGIPGDAVFVADGDHGLDNPGQIIFHDGFFYVASTKPSTKNAIMKYSTNGTWIQDIVPTGSGGLFGPTDMQFSADGSLFVVSWANDKVIRYDLSTGSSSVVADGAGLDVPVDIILAADGSFIVTSRETNQIRRYGPKSLTAFTVALSAPSSTPITVSYSTANGSAIAGSDYTAVASGTVHFASGETSKTVLIPTLDDADTESTETFNIILSNAVGATIGDGVGIGSILDNDPFTKFYVVNDASTDRTYEYGTSGASIENYDLATSNTAPRGAASSVAGTTVWVADANKSIYSYDTSGALKGSWAAGGLQTNAQLEGIATNGTDVWLVDNRTDKVYRYAKAAALTNGSPVPASSFSLNRGNTSPKDIVTDGNYLWVLNDSSIDKVFKYTIGGTFVGSWTISTSGASSPTGITLDPSKPSAIWIVDSGTDKVYQYDAAVELTSGNRSANSSWELAAGNSNPQGIADPPPPPVSSSANKTVGVKSPLEGPVPMPLFRGETSNLVSPRLEQPQSKVRSTDKFMSVVGLAFKQPTASANFEQLTSAKSDKSLIESELNVGNITDDDIEALIGLVANDLWR